MLFFSGCAQKPLQLLENVQKQNPLKMYHRIYVVESDTDVFNLQDFFYQSLQGQMPIEKHHVQNLRGPQGSGVVFTPNGHILTCAHVLPVDPKTKAIQPYAKAWVQDQPYNAQVLFVDQALDLALLQLPPKANAEAWPFIPRSQSLQPELGEKIYAFGFPLSPLLGYATRVTEGIVSARVGFQDQPQHFQFSAAIQPGNSGGPIVNERGEILGIVQSTLNSQRAAFFSGGVAPQNVNFAIHGLAIQQFLQQSQILKDTNIQSEQAQSPMARAELASVRLQDPKAPHAIASEQILTLQIFYDVPEPEPIADEIRKVIGLTSGNPVGQDTSVENFTLLLSDFKTSAPLFQIRQEATQRQSAIALAQSALAKLIPLLSRYYYPKAQEQAQIINLKHTLVKFNPEKHSQIAASCCL